MSAWRDEIEINRKALAQFNKALPEIFPSAVLTHALERRFTPPMPRLAINSYWRAHPVRADRLARALAARSGPAGWTWRLADEKPARVKRRGRKADERSRIGWRRAFAYRPRPIGSAALRGGQAFAASAASRSTGSAGTSTCGIAAPTAMPCGTPPAWSPGTCGRRRAIMRPSSSACCNGAAPRPAGRPWRIAEVDHRVRCSGCGVSTATRHAVTARLLGRAEPAGHQSGCACGEMRRGSSPVAYSRTAPGGLSIAETP